MLGINGRYRSTVVAAIVALCILGVAAAVTLDIRGTLDKSTPAVAAILAFLAPTIVALFALLRAEKTGHSVEEHDEKLEELEQRFPERRSKPRE